MISYELSEEQNIIRSTIAQMADDEVRPKARRADDTGQLDGAALAALWDTQIIQAQAFSDIERSAVTNILVLEELGAADASLALATASAIGYTCAIRDLGSDIQRAELEAQYQGDQFMAAAIAMMEPGFGTTPMGSDTKAVREDGFFILEGRKTMVPMAGRCSSFLVIADNGAALDAFIVPSNSDGVRVANPKGMLGLRSAEMADVTFDAVRVPLAMRLGGAAADIQRIIDGSRIALAAIMMGMSREILAYVIPFTKDRIVDGTPLAQRQTIAFNIADMHMDIEAMRWMTWKAAWHLDAGRSATREAQLAYSFAGQQVMDIADNGLQAFGGHGYVKENPLEMWYRNARTLSVLEGVAGV